MQRSTYILIGLILLFSRQLAGQNDPDSGRIILGYPVFSQYLHNGLMVNPAYAGSRNALSAANGWKDP